MAAEAMVPGREPMLLNDSEASSPQASDTGFTSLESDSSTASPFLRNQSHLSLTQRPFLNSTQPSAKEAFLTDLSNYIPLGSFTRPPTGEPSEDGNDHEFEESHALPSSITQIGTEKQIERLTKKRWIRIFTRKRRDGTLVVRIYVLPDDVGRVYINRDPDKSLRICLVELVRRLNNTPESWNGLQGSEGNLWTDYYDLGSKNNDSLFYIFNTLPSPSTDSLAVSCSYSKDAIDDVFEPAGLRGLKTSLYPYQKRTVATMIKREAEPTRTLDPRLQPLRGPTGIEFYHDPETGTLLRDKRFVDEACGGILGESMGLGKTLICLATIMATKGHWPLIPPEYSIGLHPVRDRVASLMQTAAAAIAHARIPWKSLFQQMSALGEDNPNCRALLEDNVPSYIIPSPSSSRKTRRPSVVPKGKTIQLCTATVVIVPQNLLSQWKGQINDHIEEGELEVLCLDASAAVPMPPVKVFHQYDVILISRQRLEQELVPSDVLQTMTKGGCSCSLDTDCKCSIKEKDQSPLNNLHFLRLIMDEGHEFSSHNNRNKTYWALQQLHVDRKWIVSGTPASGLIGVEVGAATLETVDEAPSQASMKNAEVLTARRRESALSQERKDLQKLGGIVVGFLKLKPWANSKEDDPASWVKYIMPSATGKRKPRSLQTLLESLVIRHRIEDIEIDLQLPPLHNRVVHLEPSWYDKLSINLFVLVLVVNAVTSERVDQDYMFHTKNRTTLNKLITNLRQANFHWTSFSLEDVTKTVRVSQAFLEEHSMPGSTFSKADHCLLEQSIGIGETILKCKPWQVFSQVHEMGIFMKEFPEAARDAWTLTEREAEEPLLTGATQMLRAQEWVDSHLYVENITHDLAEVGHSTMRKLWSQGERSPDDRQPGSLLNSGAQSVSPRKSRQAVLSGTPKVSQKQTVSRVKTAASPSKSSQSQQTQKSSTQNGGGVSLKPALKSALKQSAVNPSIPTLAPDSPLIKTRMIGTASAKLSYLLDRLSQLHTTEKILVFYEGDQIAYYMAQAMDLLSIRYLIYTNSLSQDRQSAYIKTFNTTPTFRVLLMDVHQAAHGLHVASASRVFFINPVWQPNVEAQAIKRAHRIGQTKPVFVETLVLKDTLEDQMLQRRKGMTAQEHQKAERSLLDDDTMSIIIKNASFIPLRDDEIHEIPLQIARLRMPQQIFGRPDRPTGDVADPDADLLLSSNTPKTSKRKPASEQAPDLPESPRPQRRVAMPSAGLPHDQAGQPGTGMAHIATRTDANGDFAASAAGIGHAAPRRRIGFTSEEPESGSSSSMFGVTRPSS